MSRIVTVSAGELCQTTDVDAPLAVMVDKETDKPAFVMNLDGSWREVGGVRVAVPMHRISRMSLMTLSTAISSIRSTLMKSLVNLAGPGSTVICSYHCDELQLVGYCAVPLPSEESIPDLLSREEADKALIRTEALNFARHMMHDPAKYVDPAMVGVSVGTQIAAVALDLAKEIVDKTR